MTKEQAEKVAAYLIKHNMYFCFINSGEFITRDYLTTEYGIVFTETICTS